MGCGLAGGFVTCEYCEVAGNIDNGYEENVPRLLEDKPDACGAMGTDSIDHNSK